MKMILFPNPDPPFNLATRYPAWFSQDRTLAPPGVRLSKRGGLWCLQTETVELTEAAGQLTATDCDVFHEGVSVYSISCDDWIRQYVRRGQEVGSIPVGVEGIDYYIADSSTVIIDHVCDPTRVNCEFFDAFEWSDGVVINRPKAEQIHMDKIRKVRNKELAAKDITFMRAVESGDTDAQSTIKTEKEALRNIPQTFDLTTDTPTPAELKQKWPEGLPKEE